MKALCAILVVCLHFKIRLGPLNALCGVAVPVFFMISGYLLYNPDNNKFQQRIIRNIKNIAQITFWATLLYFAYAFIRKDFLLLQITQDTLVYWLCFNITPFGPHLWYLFAYIYVLAIYYLLSRFNIIEYTKYAIPFLVLGFILLGKYSYFIGLQTEYRWTQNFLFDGMTFFTIGVFIKEHIEIIRLKIRRPVIFFIIFFLIAMAERLYFRNYTPNYQAPGYFSTTFLASSLFLMCILSNDWKESSLSWIGKELSLYIYIFHNIIGWELENIDDLKPFFESIGAIIVILITIIVSWIFVKAKSFIFSKIS